MLSNAFNKKDANGLHLLHFQDEEDVKAIGRLFADVGDSYVELIATGMHNLISTTLPYCFKCSICTLIFLVLQIL